MPCSHYPSKLHCSDGNRWQMWWRSCQYRTMLRWMLSGLHSMRWKQRLCCTARSSCMWVCAWIACPSGDASASPVLGSGSSSPDSGFQGFLIPATIYDIIHLLTHFPANESRTTYKYKIPVKTQQFYFITTTPGLHVSTPSSHHWALQGTVPRLSKFSCTLGSQAFGIPECTKT